MDIAIAKDYGVQVCEILGIPLDNTMSVTIHFEPDNFVYATVTRMLTQKQTAEVITLAGKADKEA